MIKLSTPPMENYMNSCLTRFGMATLLSLAVGLSPVTVMAADPAANPAVAPAPAPTQADKAVKKTKKDQKKADKKANKKAKKKVKATQTSTAQ
jgi:hypothetical protein